MKIISKISLLILIISFTSCDVLNELSQIQSFTKCEFKFDSVDNIELAGINIDNMNSWTDLGFMNIATITSALAKPNFPLNLDINVGVKNPNSRPASMSRMDWILILDGIEMTRGSLNKKVSIPANGGVSTLPINIQINLKDAMKGESGDALLTFAKNLFGMKSNPSDITVKVKPIMDVYGTQIEYPGYLTLKQTYSAQ